ncbi:MAG: hypothetical protein ACPG5P_09360, partial [Saprospiraceae bacterium]
KKGTLILNFKIENEILIATIEDNGVGRKINNKEEPRDKKSLSTTITKERLFYLTQKEDSLSIIDLEENGTPSGTKVMIKFPIA